MEKITYILGAGFSAIAGLPVMSNFISKAKDIYYADSNKAKNYKAIFDRIDELSKIKNYFHSDLFNIEELLSIYDMEFALSQKRKNNQFSSFIIDVINHYSFSDQEIHHSFPGNWTDFVFGSEDHHKNISAFVSNIHQIEYKEIPAATRGLSFTTRKINTDIHYSIVSMNYDSLLEIALTSINTNYNSNLLFNKTAFTEDWSNPMLFKLHGDVENNTIIPPTWAKNISNEMRSTWENAYNLIKTSTQIRFMGYSLPLSDSYFLYFLKAAIKNNPYLKNIDVICLDSNINEIFERYSKTISFRDFRYKNGDIKTYCKSLWERDPNHYSGIRQNVLCNTLETNHSSFMSRP